MKLILVILMMATCALSYATTLNVKLSTEDEVCSKMTATGKLTSYEFIGTNTLKLVSDYNSSSSSNKKVTCIVKGLDSLSMTSSKFLVDMLALRDSSSDKDQVDCTQEIKGYNVALPQSTDQLNVTVDLTNPVTCDVETKTEVSSEFNFYYDYNNSRSSVYTEIKTTIGCE